MSLLPYMIGVIEIEVFNMKQEIHILEHRALTRMNYNA